MCFMFQTRAFWKCMRVPTNKLNNRFEFFFGAKNIEISNRNDAKNLSEILLLQFKMKWLIEYSVKIHMICL